MRKCVFVSVLMLLLIGGCGDGSNPTGAELERRALTRKIRLVEASGGLVLMVGGETVTSDEMIESPAELSGMFVLPIEYFKPIAQVSELEQFKERAKGQFKEILTTKISSILLYQQAKREVGKNVEDALENQAEKALREFVVTFGGGDQIKADEALKQRGMDWKSFKEYQKRSILIQWYATSQLPDNRPVTYRELVDCYNEMKDEYFARPAMIQFRLIDIQPARLKLWTPNEYRELAKKLATRLLTRIQSGEDFGKLSRQYSHGPMREFGGLWQPVQPGSLAAPYDMLAAEAENTEPGQIASLVVTPEHVFIMKLEEKQSVDYEPFEKVQEQVRKKIVLDRRSEVVDRVNAGLMQQVELSKTDEFIDFCLEKIYQVRNQPVTVKRDVYRSTETQRRDTRTSIPGGVGMPSSIRRRR